MKKFFAGAALAVTFALVGANAATAAPPTVERKASAPAGKCAVVNADVERKACDAPLRKAFEPSEKER